MDFSLCSPPPPQWIWAWVGFKTNVCLNIFKVLLCRMVSPQNEGTEHADRPWLSHLIYPLTTRVVGAPQMILQPVSSIFPCSPLPFWTWRTPGFYALIKAGNHVPFLRVVSKHTCEWATELNAPDPFFFLKHYVIYLYPERFKNMWTVL